MTASIKLVPEVGEEVRLALVAALKGDKGDTGDTGDQGIQGLKGDTGDQGLKGDKGETGDRGLQGLKGDTGDRGLQGLQGIQGLKGDTGLKGDKGDQGLPGVVIGDEYVIFINTPTGIVNAGYPAARRVRAAQTFNRFFAEVMAGTTATVSVQVNGVMVHGPVVVNSGAPRTDVVSIVVAAGDTLTYVVVATATQLWLQVNGAPA